MTLKQTSKTGPSISWTKWIEPWYLTYALQGAVIAGLIPILMPILVGRTESAASIGFVMAAFSLGGLTAPVWGSLADRYRIHRWLSIGGLLLTTAGLVAFAFAKSSALWVGLALLAGLGAAGTATIANLFVVEAHPKSEWDERIGWLQTYYGFGQVGGLLLAGFLSLINMQVGLLFSAGLSISAAIIGFFTLKTPQNPLPKKAVLHQPVRHGEWAMISPQRLFHHLNPSAVKNLAAALRSPYGIFLAVWFLSIGGSAGFFSQYPVLMQKVYSVPTHLSSLAYAIIAGLALTLYSPAGRWTDRSGARRVFQTATAIRFLAYAGLAILAFIQTGTQNWLAILAFAFVVWAWSVISVSGTALAAQLSRFGEGEALGIFNAVNALAGVAGAFLGGWIAGQWGYGAIIGMAAAGIIIGLALSLKLPSTKVLEKD